MIDKLPDEDLLRHLVTEEEVEGADVVSSVSNYEREILRVDAIKRKIIKIGDQDFDFTIKMQCDTHKSPATFYSQKDQRYVCFKCLVSSEQLLYIDKKYKDQMEIFE